MTRAKSTPGLIPATPKDADRVSPIDRASLAHRLHEEIEQTLIGISLITRVHAQRLKRANSKEAKSAAKIQRLLERNIVLLDELIKTLDDGKPR